MEIDLETCQVINVNGEPVGNAQAIYNELLEHIAELTETNNNMQEHLKGLLKKIKMLQKDSAKQLREHKQFDVAMEVLKYWQATCHPEARELEGERLRLVIARLTGKPRPYSPELLKRSVLGYSKYPYLVDGRRRPYGRPSQRYIDAELIFRDPKHVDAGLALADQDEDFQQVLTESPSSLPPSPAQTNNSRPALSELGEKAVGYAKRGWLIFPCRPNAKPPATPNGLLDAKADPAAIAAYWARRPDANVAVRTGKESGLVVLDVDGDDGFESLRHLEAEYEKLPLTATIVTPRGGQHYYFAHPEVEIRNTQGVPGLGLDIRGDGGYVLAPPSQVNGRRYEVDERVGIAPLPNWLARLLVNYQKEIANVDPAEWEKMISDGVSKGARDGQLTRLAGYLLNRHEPGVAFGLLLSVNNQRCSPPLPQKDVKKIVDSLLRKRERDKLRLL